MFRFVFLDSADVAVIMCVWLIYRPPQTKILRTDSSDCMYVMNCVEVEITSPEEAFEVLFKGKTPHCPQNINIFKLIKKNNQENLCFTHFFHLKISLKVKEDF